MTLYSFPVFWYFWIPDVFKTRMQAKFKLLALKIDSEYYVTELLLFRMLMIPHMLKLSRMY